MKTRIKLINLIFISLIFSTLSISSTANAIIPTEARVGDRCEKDAKVPSAWKEYQDITWKYPDCPNPYRYVSAKLTKVTPKTSQTNRSELLSA